LPDLGFLPDYRPIPIFRQVSIRASPGHIRPLPPKGESPILEKTLYVSVPVMSAETLEALQVRGKRG